MKIQVQIVQGPAANCTFTVEKNCSCVVGRGEDVGFQIENDELISRRHFVIGFDGESISLTDLGSTNGTFVNGNALVKNTPVYLNHGQSFVAGRVSKFVVNLVGQPQYPTPQARSPIDGLRTEASPQTNSDSNIGFDAIPDESRDGPLPTSASSQEHAGGNFSKSIVQGIGGGRGVFGDGSHEFAKDESGLLFANPPSAHGIELSGERPGPSQPPSPQVSPPGVSPQDDQSLPPDNAAQDQNYHGSIAAPGDIDDVAYDFSPLAGDDASVGNQPPLANASPQPPPASPVRQPEQSKPGPSEPAEEHSPSSPFASIQGSPPLKTPNQVPPQPTQSQDTHPPTHSPTPRIPPQGSIYSPGQAMPVAAPPESPQPSMTGAGSIGLPNQLPLESTPQPSLGRMDDSIAIPPGKQEFNVDQLTNELFVHSGADESDLPLVLAALQKGFESIYCAHLSRVGMVTGSPDPTMTEKPEPETGGPDDGSNFENLENGRDESSFQSPFEDTEIEPPGKPTDSSKPDSSALQLGEPLFTWLPKETRRDFPVLLSEDEFQSEITDFWNRDAIVCLFGSSAKQLADHCHELVRMDLRTGKRGESMFGFCWPTLLHATLESQPQKVTDLIFQGGVAAFLVEDPQQERAWFIISKSDLTDLLVAADFIRKN